MKIAKTPEYHLAATFTGTTYAKPGETQDKAVKRLMASMRRAQKAPCKRAFPQWSAKMTTADYVAMFHSSNRLIDAGHSAALPRTVPTQYTGPEVEVWSDEAANDAQQTMALAA